MRLFAVFLVLTSLFACTFNKEKPSTGVAFLQGKWDEDSVENKEQLVSYEQNYITFTCDSFYLKIHTYSKVNLNGGECYNKNNWEEYAKGYYHLVKDTLKLEGNFVNQDYKYKPEGSCYR
ncbi:fumarate hydratase, partial [Pelobium sp.]